MASPDVRSELSLSGAFQGVVDSSQHVLLAHLSSLRLEVKEDLARALKSLLLIGAGMMLLNGAWLSLVAFTIHGLDDHVSLLASLGLVGSFTGLIGAGLALAGVQQLRRPGVEANARRIERADPALQPTE
jgi:uncharacterized membrane protein YqjE